MVRIPTDSKVHMIYYPKGVKIPIDIGWVNIFSREVQNEIAALDYEIEKELEEEERIEQGLPAREPFLRRHRNVICAGLFAFSAHMIYDNNFNDEHIGGKPLGEHAYNFVQNLKEKRYF